MKFRVEAKATFKLWTDIEAVSQDEAKEKAITRFCAQPVEMFAEANPENEWVAEEVDALPVITLAYPIGIS